MLPRVGVDELLYLGRSHVHNGIAKHRDRNDTCY